MSPEERQKYMEGLARRVELARAIDNPAGVKLAYEAAAKANRKEQRR